MAPSRGGMLLLSIAHVVPSYPHMAPVREPFARRPPTIIPCGAVIHVDEYMSISLMPLMGKDEDIGVGVYPSGRGYLSW